MSRVSLLFALLFVGVAISESYASSSNDTLWHILQSQNNLLVLMRHSHPNINSGDPLFWDKTGKCKNERMLSKQGKEFAKKIGTIFFEKNIKPIVISSPMCRTSETAILAFGKNYITDPILREISSGDNERYQSFLNKSKQLFIANRGDRPMVFISHRPNIEALSFELISVTELIIARVDSGGEIEVIGIIKINENKQNHLIMRTDYELSHELKEVRMKIQTLIGDAACENNNQCNSIPTGNRPCGGPSGYIVYSLLNTETTKLIALSERDTEISSILNSRGGRLSICIYEMPPEVFCNKSCLIKKDK